MNAKPDLVELRKLIGAVDGSHLKATRPFSLVSYGVPASCVIEIAGNGKTEFLSLFLKEQGSLNTIWIEKQLSINPYALWQRGVDIRSILFVECGEESIWTVQQALRSQVFQVMVLSELTFQERDLRKLQLLVEKTEAHLFLLSHTAHESWVPALQIQVGTGFKTEILRRRGFQ